MSANALGVDQISYHRWRQVFELGEQVLALARQAYSGKQSVSYEASPALASLEAQQQLILQTTERLLAGRAQLWLSEAVVHGFLEKWVRRAAPYLPLSNLMCCARDARQVCGAASAQDCPCWQLPDLEQNNASLTKACAMAAPLLVRDEQGQPIEVLGVLQVERQPVSGFDCLDAGLLDGLAVQISLALQAGLQIATERWRLEQLGLVRQVSAQIASVRDLDQLSSQITQLIQKTFGYYYVAIFTLEAGQEVLHFRACARPSEQPDALAAWRTPNLVVHLGQGMIGHAAQTGEEVLANDVRQETLYRHTDALPETQSEVSLPLKIEARLLGVLDVQSDQAGYFDETDMLVLRSLASSIASAIDGALLYQALNQRAAQLSAIYEVSSAITSVLDTDKLLNDVVDLIQQRFGFAHIHLFSVHTGRRKIFYEAGSGALSKMFREQGFAYDLDTSQGLVPWVARNGLTVRANDVAAEPLYRPSALPPTQTLAEMAVPLIFGNDVLGVLDVRSDQVNAFRDEHSFLFQALADNIAVAMRNAFLYRSEVWRRQVAESLREVAGLLSAEVDLDRVLEAILTELERNLPLEVAAIWLVDEENGGEGDEKEEGEGLSMHLAAMRGESVPELDLEIGLAPEDILDFNPASELGITPQHASDWLFETLESEQPVVRSMHSSYDPLGAGLNFPPDYSAIAAPLRIGERKLGVLTLSHHTPGRYGGEARTMTAAYASYAAVAIENTRLYEEASEQAWVSTVLLRVAEATQSLINLSELLDTVIRITPTLVGVKACLLYIFDEDGVFIPAAASGLNAQQQAEFERWRFAIGDVSALDEMLTTRQPVILHAEEDLGLSSILFDTAGMSKAALHSELLVLVPMLARGEVLGAFLVDYNPGVHGSSAASLEAFFDERLAIIQGIAHQTAVAVENIRLIKSQKEEAYVSVALLQVAQAVVSSNDLNDALGAIVRITPILVGVKRVVIFLWDDEENIFHLAQAYGIPRDATTCEYTRGEFPILDAVSEHDSLMVYPLEGGEDAFSDAPDDWSFLLPPDSEEMEEFLEREGNLLLAFPLSVKGQSLGVLLVEEPDLASAEGFGGGGSNRRLRSKRLEIITGISQQAALAIQNTLLQREMVERERLEREMQLAREIQQAFLPHSVPEISGWEMKVLWRTAREVGGDFYDFFDLPENRMGLVIADVADKGMPAALFMTLVRTLVRATVQQISSPDQVLEHVNDVLVPDAPSGMFVTLAYAVISLETGEVEFTNAGHNPPLLIRSQTGEIERLTRSGMALGVMENTPMQGCKLTIQPGDFLVMYTDGVTEAFSPEGDLFGEERLYKVLEATASEVMVGSKDGRPGAQQMLQAIDDSVTAFIGSPIPFDDLTLVILKRSSV